MRTPPLSGPALRALVAAAESPVTGDAVLEMLRKEATITAMLAVALEPGDAPPLDQRPLPSARTTEG